MWVDLPSASSREEILRVHLTKRGHAIKNLSAVVRETWGYSGAEIEKVVKSAIEVCFVENRDLSANDLLTAAKSIVPISVTMQSSISELREWASTRARPAGEPLEPKPTGGQSSRAVIEME